MKKLTLAVLAAALLGTGVSFAGDQPTGAAAAPQTPAASDTVKKPAGKKHGKKPGKKTSKKAAKEAQKPAEQPK